MRILEIREKTIPVGGTIRNAAIGFDEMTASVVAVLTDRVLGGAPIIGYGLDSIGRYGHGGLLRERLIPRLMAAGESEICEPETGIIDPICAWPVMMKNEKQGGHGERSAAVGVLAAALWDAAAKAAGLPLHRLLAERFNNCLDGGPIRVYAAGGHYHADGDTAALADEVRRYAALGHRTIKIKIGGAPFSEDRARIEAALAALPPGGRLAVDANAVFARKTALAWADRLGGYDLAWLEEPGDPLDFALLEALAAVYTGPLATGENLFSAADAQNLMRYGGMRPDRDLLQFDVSLSYGIPEYLRIVQVVEAAGWPRTRLVPHAGHMFAANVVAGLGLGGHETAPDPDSVFGGFPEDWSFGDGRLSLGSAPGVGFEAKAEAFEVLSALAS